MVLIVAAGAYSLSPGALQYQPDALTKLPSTFGYLVLIAIFVERAIEVFLSTWRSQDADVLDRAIEKLEKIIAAEQDTSKLENLHADLNIKQDERTNYRSTSRSIAQWIGLVIGVLVALVGVRVLGNIVIVDTMSAEGKSLFIMVDVLLTGAVLAGGSDAVNKMMKIYNNIMHTTAEKAKVRS